MVPPDESPPEPSMSSAESPASRRPWRVLAWVLGGLAMTLLVVCAAALWVLANLDHRWVKGPVEGLLSDLVGTEVRYEALAFSPFSGIHAKGLVVASPESLRPYADDLLRLDELHAPLEFRPLLSGEIVVPEVRGGALSLTVVATDDGRNSFSELFPSTDEPDEPSAPISHSLEPLRGLGIDVGPIVLAPIRLHTVEVATTTAELGGAGGGPDAVNADTDPPDQTVGTITRRTELAPLGLYSDGLALSEDPEGSIAIRPHQDDHVALTVIEPPGASPTGTARLSPMIAVKLTSGSQVAIDASVGLLEQTLFPELQTVKSLFVLEAEADFEPAAAKTTAVVDRLAVLDEALVANVTAALHDPEAEAAAFSSIHVDGRGSVNVPSLPWALETVTLSGLVGQYRIEGLEVRPRGVVAGEARFEATLDEAKYDEDPAQLAVEQGRIEASISAPTDPAANVGTLAVVLAFDTVRARERQSFRSTVRDFDLGIELEGIGAHDTGMLGLRGTGTLRTSVERFTVNTRDITAASKGAMLVDVDFENSLAEGALPVDFVAVNPKEGDPVRVQDAVFRIRAKEPTFWNLDLGSPSVALEGSIDRVKVGERSLRAPSIELNATRTKPDHYTLGAEVTADQVSWGRFRREPPTTLAVQAEADASRPAVDAKAELAIAGREPTTMLLAASHDAPTSRYVFEASGSEAGPLLGAIVFGDGGHRADRWGFSLSSRGRFRGLFREKQDGTLAMSREPARTTRGSHRTELRVDEMKLVRFELTHELKDFTTTVASNHEAPGKGSFDVTSRIGRARYGDRKQPMTIYGYQQGVDVAYAALHGAPSFTIQSRGSLSKFDQPYVPQYPVANVSFGVDADVDETQVYAVRQLFWRNPAGGSRFEAQASYEGWSDAVRETEVCVKGTVGCPQVASLYGREAANVTGLFEQDFSRWRSTDRTHSEGSLSVPFTIESGDLNTYRVLATARFRDVVLELPQFGVVIDDLDAQIPIDQEFATEPEFFVVPSRAANAMARKRFFDLYPFTERDSFFTVDRVQVGPEVVGPIAANMHVAGSTVTMDQIHAAYREGFVTGQFLANLNRDDPEVAFRGHLTGVRVEKGKGVLDANLAMSFVPTTLIVEGKAQIVRVSKDHLYAILDAVDPYHEDEDINRVRLGLKFGYPKYVRVNFDEGLMDTKIDLGGLAGAIRIDEIRGIPVTPFLEQYVQPYLERVFSPSLLYQEPPPDIEDAPQVSRASEVSP
ncbi:MAG: hypothetical protein AAF997_07800 [Myxococcota bacterium]